MNVVPIVPIKSATKSTPQPTAAGKNNFAGFDFVRAFAALAVVLLHACVPYLQNPMPGLLWSVQDRASRLVDCAFWGIEVVVMPVFLVLAGFLAWQTLQRREPGQLVRSRAKRLLIPLLFGMVVVLPLDLYLWALSWVGEGLVAPVKLKSLKFNGIYGDNIWGLSHLWFLLYLFLYVAVFAAAAAMIKRLPERFRSARRSAKHTNVKTANRALTKTLTLVLFVVGVSILTFRPEVVWGFQHQFAPVPSKWFYSGTFFVGGLLLAFYDRRLIRSQFFARRMIVPAMCLLVATVVLGRWQFQSADQTFASALGLAVATTGSAWLVTLCVIGVATKYIQKIPLPIQYLAAASFWVYLVHHPILGLVHADLKLLLPSASPVIKVILSFGISVGLSLLTYESLVRRTKLGRWLGFAWTIPLPDEIESESVATTVASAKRRAA